MSDTAILFENISKQYRLGLVNTRTISHDFNRWWQTSILKKEDPYLQIGEKNRRSVKGESEYVWALQNINYEVKKGDVVGIIGKNGSGKSTLLKILSRITIPTTGSIKIDGRIASLLEVGTGFHPELTGRENVFLNGAILGMTKSEIKNKFDEIVDFSGIERYIDTPVKRYSSGMRVRLGFAVAAHLEPEMLVVDEVLAVGDSEFQKKAIGKMQDISQADGRTVLFVSHNMVAVKNLCQKGLMLEDGEIKYVGDVNDVVDKYLIETSESGTKNNQWKIENAPGTDIIKIRSAYVQYDSNILDVKTPFDIVTEFWCMEDGFETNVSLNLYDKNSVCVFNIMTEIEPLKKGLYRASFQIPGNLLNEGYYYVHNLFKTKTQVHWVHKKANTFEIADNRENNELFHGSYLGAWQGVVRPMFIKRKCELIDEMIR